MYAIEVIKEMNDERYNKLKNKKEDLDVKTGIKYKYGVDIGDLNDEL